MGEMPPVASDPEVCDNQPDDDMGMQMHEWEVESKGCFASYEVCIYCRRRKP